MLLINWMATWFQLPFNKINSRKIRNFSVDIGKWCRHHDRNGWRLISGSRFRLQLLSCFSWANAKHGRVWIAISVDECLCASFVDCSFQLADYIFRRRHTFLSISSLYLRQMATKLLLFISLNAKRFNYGRQEKERERDTVSQSVAFYVYIAKFSLREQMRSSANETCFKGSLEWNWLCRLPFFYMTRSFIDHRLSTSMITIYFMFGVFAIWWRKKTRKLNSRTRLA